MTNDNIIQFISLVYGRESSTYVYTTRLEFLWDLTIQLVCEINRGELMILIGILM